MTQALVSMQVELQPFPEDNRPLIFDVAGAGGPVTVYMAGRTFDENADILARIAAHTLEAKGDVVFGAGDQDRVIFGFGDHNTVPYRFSCTVARLTGATHEPTVLTAQLSNAALTRLADGFTQLKNAGQGAFGWNVAP
jgi:hypothetical protein